MKASRFAGGKGLPGAPDNGVALSPGMPASGTADGGHPDGAGGRGDVLHGAGAPGALPQVRGEADRGQGPQQGADCGGAVRGGKA